MKVLDKIYLLDLIYFLLKPGTFTFSLWDFFNKSGKSTNLIDLHWLLKKVGPQNTFKAIAPETSEFMFSFPTHPVKPGHLEATSMPSRYPLTNWSAVQCFKTLAKSILWAPWSGKRFLQTVLRYCAAIWTPTPPFRKWMFILCHSGTSLFLCLCCFFTFLARFIVNRLWFFVLDLAFLLICYINWF